MAKSPIKDRGRESYTAPHHTVMFWSAMAKYKMWGSSPESISATGMITLLACISIQLHVCHLMTCFQDVNWCARNEGRKKNKIVAGLNLLSFWLGLLVVSTSYHAWYSFHFIYMHTYTHTFIYSHTSSLYCIMCMCTHVPPMHYLLRFQYVTCL